LNSDTRLKFLTADGTGPYSGFAWPLPHSKSRPGKWVKAEGPLVACANGIHVVTLKHATEWANNRLYTVETRGEVLDANNKLVAREARLLYRVGTWNETTARLFACDCAERALRRVTRKHGEQDPRSWRAIWVARKFARGGVARVELAAARDAAWAAAGVAAGAAARDAAWAAARAAEREWQAVRLGEYLNGERT
jgi:hypothetical protein